MAPLVVSVFVPFVVEDAVSFFGWSSSLPNVSILLGVTFSPVDNVVVLSVISIFLNSKVLPIVPINKFGISVICCDLLETDVAKI